MPFRPLPLGQLELLLVRLATAFVVWSTVPAFISYASMPSPVGLAAWDIQVGPWSPTDFTWLADPQAMFFARIALAAALLAFVAGWCPSLSLGYALFLTIAIGTLTNSQGKMTHHLNVVSLALLAQWPFWAYRDLRVLFGKMDSPSFNLSTARWATFAAQQALVAAYVVSAITKLRVSGFDWIRDAKNFPIQIEKAQAAQHYNVVGLDPSELPPPPFGPLSELAAKTEGLLVMEDNLTQAILASGLALELFAFLALVGRRSNVVFALLLISFHLTIGAVMSLNFKYNIALLAVFFLLPHLVRAARLHLLPRPYHAPTAFFLLFLPFALTGPPLNALPLTPSYFLIAIPAGLTLALAWAWPSLPQAARRRLDVLGQTVLSLPRRSRLAPFLILTAASFIVLIPQRPYLDYALLPIPEGFSRGEQLRRAEVYPLSSFSMYSDFSSRPIYCYISDAQTGELIPARSGLGVNASAIKKIYDDALRVVAREQRSRSLRNMPPELLEMAGIAALETLRSGPASAAFASGALPPTIALHEVAITFSDDDQIVEHDRIVATIDTTPQPPDNPQPKTKDQGLRTKD